VSQPRYTAWVCPYCGQQSRGPAGHSVAGDDICSTCPVGSTEHGVPPQPRLVKIEVEPVDGYMGLMRVAAKRGEVAAARRRVNLERASE
jgi:hypothetical protein